jgi:hypothetical protein
VEPGDDKVRVPMLSGPEKITLLVAGGVAGAFSAVVPPWGGGKNSKAVTLEVRIPD